MKINKKELHTIFEGIKKHNETEFNKLYKEYKNLLYGIAFAILKNKEDSEETVQAIFMKILKLPNDKLPSENEASWLYTLTKNEAISLLRKRKEYLNIEDIYEIGDDCNEINNTIDKIRYNQLIRKLSNTEKEIVSLKILSDCSFNEIAELINKPVGTVKWKYYKAVNTLKIMLSNLAMFIITFIIGFKTVKKQNKSIHQENNENTNEQESNIKNEQENTNRESEEDEAKKENISNVPEKDQESSDEKQDTITENIVKDTINETKQETIIEQNTNSYVGICMLSISAIFLTITIIFLIILLKYKLKSHSKSSK